MWLTFFLGFTSIYGEHYTLFTIGDFTIVYHRVGILDLIVSIPGLSVLTLYLMKIHELKVMSAMMGEQTVKASLKTSNNFDQANMML